MNQSTSASRGGLFLAAGLLGASFIGGVIATNFHPSGIDPNNHPLVFVQYAHSWGWTADHAGWFFATALAIAGFLALLDALNLTGGVARIAVRIGMVLGGAAIAITALREVVDGVVLKRAVDAWVIAPSSEQASRFAAAEVARWMEEGAYSYQSYLLAMLLAVLAGLIIWTGRMPRPLGIVLAVAAVANFALGWILGESGFAPQGAAPAIVTEFVPPVVAIYLGVVAWRMSRVGVERPQTKLEPAV